MCNLLIEAKKYLSVELKKFCIEYLVRILSDVSSMKAFEEFESKPLSAGGGEKTCFLKLADKDQPMN